MKFTTKLINARSRFIYKNQEDEPTHIYRHDQNQFELIEIKSESIVCEINIQDVKDKDSMKNIVFQYAHYLYDGDKLLFIIATQTTDGLESFLYLFDPFEWQSTLKRLSLTKKLKGRISNIFVSKAFQNERKDYHILTIGTLDSAVYVARFTFNDIMDKSLGCALIRTDGRNAITQEVIGLTQQQSTKSPDDLLLLSGGFNGALDFFLIKGDTNILNIPVLEYQRHYLLELPSKLPIVSLQWLRNHNNDKEIVLAVGQELFKPLRNSRIIDPSMTIMKINIKDLICKDTESIKLPSGTHLNPLQKLAKNHYKLWTSFFDTTELRITSIEVTKDAFNDQSNTFLSLPDDDEIKDLQQIHIQDEDHCWILDSNGYIKLSKTNIHKKRRHNS